MMHNGFVLQADGMGSRGRRMLTALLPMCRSPESRDASFSKEAGELTIWLRSQAGREVVARPPARRQPLLLFPGRPQPRRARALLPASTVPPAPGWLGSPGRQLPRGAAASAPLANLRARRAEVTPAAPSSCQAAAREPGRQGSAAESAGRLTR